MPLHRGFRFIHEPLPVGDASIPVLGHGELVGLLRERLVYSHGGTFLVTGFRGVGKTTLVLRALAEAVTDARRGRARRATPRPRRPADGPSERRAPDGGGPAALRRRPAHLRRPWTTRALPATAAGHPGVAAPRLHPDLPVLSPRPTRRAPSAAEPWAWACSAVRHPRWA
ncbi:hypothetical protein LT493_33845 [Streptomyces tricolor]|nr:hypothetical protein [Streptomyces tricolor]